MNHIPENIKGRSPNNRTVRWKKIKSDDGSTQMCSRRI